MLQGPYIIRTLPRRWKGIIYHEALIMPDRETGQLVAIDITTASVNPRVTPLADYLSSRDAIIRKRELPGLDESATWANFDRLRTTRTYDLLTYNCDHFLDEVLAQKARSEQVFQKIAIALLMLLLVYLLVLWIYKKAS